ncbi:MAG: DUF1295 domain-containing protein [Nocardioidaceae bacterium]|nr:DUF1295 domain-containing protein [Nocardioidaceae bacterium]
MSPLAIVALTALVSVAGVMTTAAAESRRRRRYAVVDAAWGAAFAVLALAGGVAGQLSGYSGGSAALVRWLLVALVAAWGGRLSWHLWRRVVAADHDDPRYEELLGGPFLEVPFGQVLAKVFALQGVIVLVVSAPVVTGLALRPRVGWSGWLVAAGCALWLLGMVFEVVGDAQLAAYRADPGRGPILDTGLWAWTRHPNYFGDACVWWGLWLAGGATAGPWWVAIATLPAPVVMTFFLVVGSGARPTERRMQGRPGWDAYAATTPMFLPRPPRGH